MRRTLSTDPMTWWQVTFDDVSIELHQPGST